jgi:membrane-bound serine protease (ClpP class)
MMQILRSWVFALGCGFAAALAGRAEELREAEPAVVEAAPEPAAATPAATEEATPAEPAPSAPAVAETSADPSASPTAVANLGGEPVRVKVIPVRDAIGRPVLYVIRRGLKEAQAEGMRAVILDMETPGGQLGVTLEIMEALDKFDGETLVYVNKEAISAGAIIASVVDEIHFAPGGVIGAAAAVSGGGAEIPETMKQKINSYLNAKVRSFNTDESFRADVIRAMMDADFEFKIGEDLIKPKGELLALTAQEAAKTYGDPPRPLLSAGTHATLEDLLASKFGEGGFVLSKLEVSWSEELAAWLSRIAPLLMGLGMLCVFIEFKTPGFGIFGIAGGIMLALVFFGHHAAGLSGHVPALVFVLGVALVAVEIFLIPGTLVAGITGAALMLGALVWSMVDVWPGEMPKLDGDLLLVPFLNVAAALVIAVIGAIALGRFLPRGWFWDKMILQTAVAGDAAAPIAGRGAGADEFGDASGGMSADALLGARGRTVSVLRPMGEVEIDGRRHEARAAIGSLERDEPVRVTGRMGRTLIVEREDA